ncbi:hypothetical protein RF11_15215 [Thelohanellus kitauei]|uniref:Uncharacterized protein n=1 Tax=Thelohanellus kitauei TaxID=669202 RepID=A0A0C2MZF4_THEKT|nr:hypothetical protein RF11_15215 [Thelohanellus kitauei]
MHPVFQLQPNIHYEEAHEKECFNEEIMPEGDRTIDIINQTQCCHPEHRGYTYIKKKSVGFALTYELEQQTRGWQPVVREQHVALLKFKVLGLIVVEKRE